MSYDLSLYLAAEFFPLERWTELLVMHETSGDSDRPRFVADGGWGWDASPSSVGLFMRHTDLRDRPSIVRPPGVHHVVSWSLGEPVQSWLAFALGASALDWFDGARMDDHSGGPGVTRAGEWHGIAERTLRQRRGWRKLRRLGFVDAQERLDLDPQCLARCRSALQEDE